MVSMAYKFEIEEKKYYTTKDTEKEVKMDNYLTDTNSNIHGNTEGISFSRFASAYRGRGNNEIFLLGQQETSSSNVASAIHEINESLNFQANGSEVFDDVDQSSNNFYVGSSRSESGLFSSLWNETTNGQYPRTEMNETFDFLIKSLLSANNFISSLNREQLAVLRSIRPSLLYEFLQEIAKARSDRRQRRNLPNECAFCKNNGENEECFSSHTLKDWRGRVLCPVLRAFRCPRCGATGDRAHTIKYCPENSDSERFANFSWRRRSPTYGLFNGSRGTGRASHHSFASPAPTPTPATSPSPGSITMASASSWAGFGIN